MNARSTFKASASALALGLTLALSSGAAFSQVDMHKLVVKAHKADIDNMISDLAKVGSADVAKGYEGYLGKQMGQYTSNHKKLNGLIPGLTNAHKIGKVSPDMREAGEEINKLNDEQYVKLNAEMARVEKLNPLLKKHFDVLRALND